MRYKFVIPTLYILSTLLLFSEWNKLGDILQKSGEKKASLSSAKEKNQKKSRFIFEDTYNKTMSIDSIDENAQKTESKSKKYVYENKSRFKFKFAPGTEYNNIEGGQDTVSIYVGDSSVSGRMMGSSQGSERH